MKPIKLLTLSLLFFQVTYAQQTVFVIDTSNSGIPSNLVSSVYFDSNDHLWVGTENDGIGKYDGTSWTYYNTSNTSALLSDHINDINQAPNGDMWFGTGLGIAVLSNNAWTFYDTTVIDYYSYVSSTNKKSWYQLYIQFDSKGNAYTLVHNTKKHKGLKLYKFENGTWSVAGIDSTTSMTGYHGYPRDFVIDQNDDIWVASGYKFNDTNWVQAITIPGGFDNTSFEPAIAVDNNNNIWTQLEKYGCKCSVPVAFD